ncbi:MAG: cyclic nucleotide-binding domain-containing protein, partial [Pseudomonadales bacterium]
MHQQLSRFEAFAGLDRAALLTLAQHAKLVLLPAGRWLVRRGRSLPGAYYLVRGSVRTSTPDRVIHADTSLARQAIHPGAREVRTLTDCRFLRLHPQHLECLDVLSNEPRARLADVTESDDCWQVRFLCTHLMTALSPALWQQVLRRLAPLQLDAGDRVINEGDAGNVRDCFILASGHATVTR